MARRRGPAASLLLAGFAVGWSGCATAPTAPPPPRPNVVLFLVDDLGWQDLGEPFATERSKWNDRYETPNVERLCRQGTKFPNAYAHPICSPSRISLLTGAHAARHRVTHWTLRQDQPTDPERKGLRRPNWNQAGLSCDPATPHAACYDTLPARLRRNGYRTILVGKAHLGAVDTPGADPTNLGFDVNIAGHAAGAPASYLARNGFAREGGDPVWNVPGLDFYRGSDRFLTDVLTDEALLAADRARAAGQPFFLYLAHYAVHAPFDADERYVQRYRDRGLSEPEARYAALVRGVDDSLGRVLDWLEQNRQTNTIVVFASDNGGLSASARGGEKHMHNLPLRSGKGSAYEGGIRVPFAIQWPGHVTADAVEPLPIQLEDVMPTLCELVGVDPQCPDGHAFARRLAGMPTVPHPLFFHHPHYWGATGPGIEPFSAVRDGDLKLIWFYQDERAELYDLAVDIGEHHDLAAERPDDVARLRLLLRRQLTACAAQVPTRDGGAPCALP
ncbi:MAG: sulfatase [Planctomycetes bacterium]|nr:sulfatase [Planctomycetota bacterium]